MVLVVQEVDLVSMDPILILNDHVFHLSQPEEQVEQEVPEDSFLIGWKHHLVRLMNQVPGASQEQVVLVALVVDCLRPYLLG